MTEPRDPVDEREQSAEDAAAALAELRATAELLEKHNGKLEGLSAALEASTAPPSGLKLVVKGLVEVLREQLAFASRQLERSLERHGALVDQLEAAVEIPPIPTPGETMAARLGGVLRCSGCSRAPNGTERARIATDRLGLGIAADQIAAWTCDACRSSVGRFHGNENGAFFSGSGSPVGVLRSGPNRAGFPRTFGIGDQVRVVGLPTKGVVESVDKGPSLAFAITWENGEGTLCTSMALEHALCEGFHPMMTSREDAMRCICMCVPCVEARVRRQRERSS